MSDFIQQSMQNIYYYLFNAMEYSRESNMQYAPMSSRLVILTSNGKSIVSCTLLVIYAVMSKIGGGACKNYFIRNAPLGLGKLSRESL